MTRSLPKAIPTLDVRGLSHRDYQRLVITAYDSLHVGQAMLLITDQEPLTLREAFKVDHPDSHLWEDQESESHHWRTQITKQTSTALPRVVGDTDTLNRTQEPGALTSLSCPPLAHRRLRRALKNSHDPRE